MSRDNPSDTEQRLWLQNFDILIFNNISLIILNEGPLAEYLTQLFTAVEVSTICYVWSMSALLLTCPKFTAACCAEALKIMTVRYSVSSSRVFMDLGNSTDGLGTRNWQMWAKNILQIFFTFLYKGCCGNWLCTMNYWRNAGRVSQQRWHHRSSVASCLYPQTIYF